MIELCCTPLCKNLLHAYHGKTLREKGENTGYQHFLHFPQSNFLIKQYFLRVVKTWLHVEEGLSLSQTSPGFDVSAVPTSNFSFSHSVLYQLTHNQTTNFRLFQTERVDFNFKFDENGRKLSKQVENTVGKGEIAHYEQFLLFPQCFQKACFPGTSQGVIVWEWVKGTFCYFSSNLKLSSANY